jgi:hypothetical protein
MRRAYILISSIALVLSACGGGSDPATSPPPPVGTMTDLVITGANAKPAARVAYGSTTQSTETGGLVGDTGLASTPDSGLQKPGIERSLASAIGRALKGVPLGPDTYDCGVAGTMTISGNLASLFTLTAGDTINMEAEYCDDGLGEVVNGRMEFTVAVFSGDVTLGMYLLDMGVLLIDYEVATAEDTITSNGDSLVSMDTTGNPMIFMAISGSSMVTVSNSTTQIMTNFDTSQSVNTGVQPEPYTLSSSGTVDNSELGGIISFSTPVTFQGSGAAYPYAGELEITGANGSRIRLIALDDVNVRIETYSSGGNTPDSTEDTTWDDIAP